MKVHILSLLVIIFTCFNLTTKANRRVTFSNDLSLLEIQKQIVQDNKQDNEDYPGFRKIGMLTNITTQRYSTAVLIGPDVILTAGHVFRYNQADPGYHNTLYRYRFDIKVDRYKHNGKTGQNEWVVETVSSFVNRVEMHPGWEDRLHAAGGDGDGDKIGSDLAIAWLDRSPAADFATYGVAKLPPDNFTEPIGSRIVMAGYGAVYNGATGVELENRVLVMGENTLDRVVTRVNKPGLEPHLLGGLLVSDYDSPQSEHNKLSSEHGVVGYIGTGDSDPDPVYLEATTCVGDSGSPLFMQVNGEWLLVGINSYGTNDLSTYGDISMWTRVGSHLSWIRHHLHGDPWVVDWGQAEGNFSLSTQINTSGQLSYLGGSVNIEGVYDSGNSVTLTATPSNSGYIFSGWSGDASGTSTPLTITADSDKTITANFSKDEGDDDGDGISNYEEIVTYGTSKSSNDSDGDGLTDKEETDRGLNPNSSDKAIIDAVMELKGMKADDVTPIVNDWYYVPNRGWFWTSKDVYPYTYSVENNDWMYFQSGNEKPKFYRYKTKDWVTFE
jgi:uncharacterized repeat protein (TIGR02543 family)